MSWSDGGHDSDERWVLKREPRDPRGLLPPTRTELLVYAAIAIVFLVTGMLLVVRG